MKPIPIKSFSSQKVCSTYANPSKAFSLTWMSYACGSSSNNSKSSTKEDCTIKSKKESFRKRKNSNQAKPNLIKKDKIYIQIVLKGWNIQNQSNSHYRESKGTSQMLKSFSKDNTKIHKNKTNNNYQKVSLHQNPLKFHYHKKSYINKSNCPSTKCCKMSSSSINFSRISI